ncbi:MAG: FAD-dependent oxidoreductase [Burkholderiales bacterium]|nr:FAD-dependent oxidoreductase [Burkholderiales bacterium]
MIELVDADLCNGCRLCLDTCPTDCFRLDTVVAQRAEQPPCQIACPAGVDMRRYLYLVREGMIDEAIGVLEECLPLASVTGRICPHPCESACARKDVDEAVNINSLERFVGDRWIAQRPASARVIYRAKVAVVGSGPAGLACAYVLARKGYPVTIFDSMPEAGGMLRYGVPDFRLPRAVLDAQVDYLRAMGIEFRLNTPIGRATSLDDLTNEYQAVFVAVGASRSRKIDIDGKELTGVLWGLEFLRDANAGKPAPAAGKKVVVIGGGNVAMDAALTVNRLGAARVQMVCLESEAKMPAYAEEKRQALEEGVVIDASWGPRKIVGRDGKVAGIELVRCVGVTDSAGRFAPSFDEGETKFIEADLVILSIGQEADLSLLPDDVRTTASKTIRVDPLTLQSSRPGVFAGGDAVSGSATVVEAIAAGKAAAVSIDRLLKAEDLRAGRDVKPKRVMKPPKERIPHIPRQPTPWLPVRERSANFEEVKRGFSDDTTRLEAQRCMTCGSRAIIAYPEDCQMCIFCERDCPTNAIYVSPDKTELPMMAWR